MDENINEAKEEIASEAPAQGAPRQAEPQPAPAVQPQKGKDSALLFELGIIAFGELVVCYALGLPMIYGMRKLPANLFGE